MVFRSPKYQFFVRCFYNPIGTLASIVTLRLDSEVVSRFVVARREENDIVLLLSFPHCGNFKIWALLRKRLCKGCWIQTRTILGSNPSQVNLLFFLLLVSVERCKRESVCIYSTHRGVSVRICLRASRVRISLSPRC